MDKFNDIFYDLGARMPFGKDFFTSYAAFGDAKVSTMFLVIAALAISLVALIVIIICSVSIGKSRARARAAANRKVPTVNDGMDTISVVTIAKTTDATQDASTDSADAPLSRTDTADVALEEIMPVQNAAPVAPATPAPEDDDIILSSVTTRKVADPIESPAVSADEGSITSTHDTEELGIGVDLPPQAGLGLNTQDNNSDALSVALEDTDMKNEKVKKAPVSKTNDKKAPKALVGTFEVSLCLDGYRFYLYASNKQLMYESVGFTSSEGAMKGIETFRKTLQENPYIITRDKYDHYRYVFNKRYQGENYTSAASAQSAAESVKRWAENAKVIIHNPRPEEIDAYKKGLDSLRTKDDVDWDKVAKEEAAERKMGKFTVEEDGNQDEVIGYRFYLIANNAQILYTSSIYTTAVGALKAIDAFKRAVYIGNFYVDEDKSGRYRYILRSNATTTYVGESYTSKARAESSIESVKKFVKCAAIVPYKKTAEEE